MSSSRNISAPGMLIVLALALPLDAQQAAMDPRLTTAEQLYRHEGCLAALPEFEKLRDEFKNGDDARNHALAQGYIGECYWRLGNFDQARNNLDLALTLKKNLNDRLQEGKTLNVLGLLEWDQGNFEAAISRFGEASTIGQELGDRKLQGATLNNLSMVLDDLGDYRTSMQQYEQVLDIYSGIDFPRGTGDTLGNIGGVHLLLGRFSEAVGYYQQALAISESLDSKPAMSQDHGNLGFAYTGTGHIDLALMHFDKALALARETGMRQEEGLWLRGKAEAEVKAGRYDLGLENHREALLIFEEVENPALLLEALHDTGTLLLSLGDPASAERHFQRAIEYARSIAMSRGVTINLLALGDLQYRHQRLEEAAALYQSALKKSVNSGELHYQSQALLRLAVVHRDQEKLDEAISECLAALGIATETGARSTEADARLMLADLDFRRGSLASALSKYDSAYILATKLGDPELLWQIAFKHAGALVQSDQKQAAVNALLQAVNHIESVRNRLGEKRFRAGYIQNKTQVYVELVRLQLDMGRKEDAFSTAERLKTWSYLEQSGRNGPDTWTREQKLAEVEMRERIRQLQNVLEDENSKSLRDQRQLAVETFSQELLLAEQAYVAFLDDVDRSLSRSQPGPDRIHQAELKQYLNPGEALIEYVSAPAELMIFVLTANGLNATSVPLRQADLHARLELLRDLLQQRETKRWQRPAASLSTSLLDPVKNAGWLNGITHLYLVPQGMLHYLPFALLSVSSEGTEHLLVDHYSIAYLPSAQTLANDGHSRVDTVQNVLTVAPERSRLRYAPAEASAIAEMFSPNSRLLAGKVATESSFRKLSGNYRVLHLATHGYFNKMNPLLSGLELEADNLNDGLLEVHEIQDLELDSELVTLSACETGLGSGFFAEIPAGDDFVGMTRAFLEAGSASVLATLWEVDDRSTVDLMQSFYQMLENSSPDGDKATALANAQRALRTNQKYEHPYYWAPFVLVGSMNQHNRNHG